MVAIIDGEFYRPKRRSLHKPPQRRHRPRQNPIRQLVVISILSVKREALGRRPLHLSIVADDGIAFVGVDTGPHLCMPCSGYLVPTGPQLCRAVAAARKFGCLGRTRWRWWMCGGEGGGRGERRRRRTCCAGEYGLVRRFEPSRAGHRGSYVPAIVVGELEQCCLRGGREEKLAGAAS